MNWFTLVINTLIISNLVIQHQQMLRLYRYQDLDSSSMHKLFRAYFYICFFFGISSVDFHHFKIPSLPTAPEIITTENMVFSICLIVISTVYIVSLHTSQPLDNSGTPPYYTEELERQLLLSTDSFKSTDPIVHIISTPVSQKKPPSSSSLHSEMGKVQQFHGLQSKDISPIQSYGNALHQYPQQQASSSQPRSSSKGRKFSAVKTPILATLLSADNVLAAIASSSSSNDSLTHWTKALPVLITSFYIASQCVYSFSVVKTNVYTPYKPFHLSAFGNVVLGLIINTTTLLTQMAILSTPLSSLVQFPTNYWINYTVGSLLIVQGVTSLVYYVLLTRKRSAIYSRGMSVQVYNSMSSPSLHSVY